MKIRLLAASLIVVSALVPSPSRAQQADPRSDLLVSTAWLAGHINDPNLVLLHVGSREGYDAEHLPGARFVDLDDVSVSEHEKPGALMLQMPDNESLRNRLQGLGIFSNSRVVVYYARDWVTPATRVVLTLDYAGLGAQTSLLDGNLDLWKQEKRAVTKEVPAVKQGTLANLRIKPVIVDGDWVKANIGKPGIAVVDGRASVFYDGVDTGRGMHAPHKTGHIAGAKSIPFTEITDRTLRLKSRDELAALFTKAGVKPGDTIVGYCHIGQQATGMLFAARTLGYKVLLYDGSFEDWSARDGAVETAARK
jgi:thiosulfate/3-mercaptopyruvate sulfurtransferase